MGIKIAPSILSADFSCLGQEIKNLVDSSRAEERADIIHIDVMDGHFVPNLTFGPCVIEAIRPLSPLPFDVHLMIEPVSPFIEAYAAIGADMITFHIEASKQSARDIALIKDLGKKAGIALNPATSIETISEVLDKVDLVVLMSVNPGFSGQYFIDSSYDKLKRLRAMIGGRDISISIDGGVTVENAPRLRKAGADILVAGSSIYKNPPYGKIISQLRG